MHFLALSLYSLLLVVLAWNAAPAEPETYMTPAEAGPDYALQGEYLGESEVQTWGSQVIALGDGKFRVVNYEGGLPGDGWVRGNKTLVGEGQRQGDTLVAQGRGWKGKITDGIFIFTDEDGQPLATMTKKERKSPTLGAEPPANANVLFNGKSADAFENGKIVLDDLLAANCASKQKFGDHSLHLEFRTPFKPTARGQARGNSGVYVQSRYEIQVLDSFGLEGKNNECGGIYSIAEPAVNMCFPPLTWQTYDIDFTAARYNDAGEKTADARVTVRQNGVVIHDNLVLPHGTPGRLPEGPGPEALYLQGHGNPVVYRNIWAVEK